LTKIRLRQNVHDVPLECGVADGMFGMFWLARKIDDVSVRARLKNRRLVHV
jgi:hypothetical protein